MKNKFLLLVVAVLMTSAVASAQESRKLLTIEDVVLNYKHSKHQYNANQNLSQLVEVFAEGHLRLIVGNLITHS